MSSIGHARQRGEKWEIRYRIGRKLQTATIAARSEREAMAEIGRRVAAGAALSAPAKLDVATYLRGWLDAIDVRATTRAGYSTVCKVHLIPALGHIRLRELTAQPIRAAFVKFKAAGLASNTRRAILITLKAAIRDAIIDDLLAVDPLAKLKAKSGGAHPLGIENPPETVKVTPPEKIVALLAEESPYRILITLMIASGIRRGESLALRWRNVDFDKATIRITEQRVPLAGGAGFAAPKSASGVRSIRLPQEAIDALQAHRAAMRERLFANGVRLTDDMTVACNDAGEPLDPNSFGSWARRRGFNLHGLRHFHLSALVNSGIPIAAVSKRAGHSTIATTLAVYVHAEASDDDAAAAVAGGLMR